MKIRTYASYDDYVSHQSEKVFSPRHRYLLERTGKARRWRFSVAFNRHRKIIESSNPRNAIAFGARMGHEVQALRDMGLDALGIDLVPCEPLVVFGDFHNAPFSDGTFGFGYSNAFDHSLYPDRFASELKRLVAAGGHVLLHLAVNVRLDSYGVVALSSAAEVSDLFGDCVVVSSTPMTPWHGLNHELMVRLR